jgi:hypothetical protein
MKKSIFLSLAVMYIIVVSPAFSQSKVAITDKAQFLNEEIESMLSDRIKMDSLELTTMIDTRRRCDYWFVILAMQADELIITVLDCNEKFAGSKNIGSKVLSAKDSEKALLLYFAISEVLEKPYKKTAERGSQPIPEVSALTDDSELHGSEAGQHKTRYFFAPSSYNLEEGELYYNSLYFFIHDVQYGLSNKFSIGMGTTLMGFPFYVTPKITIPVDDNSAFAIGDMLLIGTWGTRFSGNLLYGTYTRGGYFNNFTLGAGFLHTGDNDITSVTNSPVFNFSGLLQVSSHIYFITENYSSMVKTKQSADYYYYNPDPPYEYDFQSGEFQQNIFFIYGLTGFRFINRAKDLRSWQFGLSYIFRSFGDVPSLYNSGYWTNSANTGSKFIAFPVVGYARKFSTKY